MADNTTKPVQAQRTNYRLSIAIGAACFLWMLNFLALTPFFPFIAKDLNTSVALLGQVSGLVAFGSIPVGMITGPLADRYGHRKVLLAGMSAVGVGSLITAIAPSYGVLVLMAPFGAVCQAVVRPLAVAIAGAHLAGDNLRGAVGLATIGMSVATIAGIPILTTIESLGGWRVSFGFLTALNVLATVYLAWTIPPDAPTSVDAQRSRLGLSAYASLVADFPTMLLIGSSLVRSISLWGFNTYRGAFFVDRFGVTTQEVGWIFTIAGIGLFLGGTVASSRFSKLPLYWLAIVGTAAIALGGGLALVLPLGILPAIALTTLTAFGLGFSLVATDTLIVNRADGQRGTATSLNRVSTNVGVAVGSSGGGLMIAVDGYPLLGTTVLCFGAGALLLLWLSRASGRASSETGAGPLTTREE